MSEMEKKIPSLKTLRDIVTVLVRSHLLKNNMMCEVCRGPATCITKDVPQGRFCGIALCDKDAGNRNVIIDPRAETVRQLQKFLEEFDS